MAKDIFQMSRRDLDRLMVLEGVLRGEVAQVRAAEVLGLSDRQIRRMVDRINQEARALAKPCLPAGRSCEGRALSRRDSISPLPLLRLMGFNSHLKNNIEELNTHKTASQYVPPFAFNNKKMYFRNYKKYIF